MRGIHYLCNIPVSPMQGTILFRGRENICQFDIDIRVIRDFSDPIPFFLFFLRLRVRGTPIVKTRGLLKTTQSCTFNGVCGVWSHFNGKLAEQIRKLIFNLPICNDKTAPLSTVVS